MRDVDSDLKGGGHGLLRAMIPDEAEAHLRHACVRLMIGSNDDAFL